MALALQLCLAADVKIGIAVNDLQAKGVTQSEADMVSERLRVELLNTNIFRVMERGQMEQILKEQGFQQSGVCTDQSCLVEAGQLLGVQRMVAGTIGKIGSTYSITIRMINVATGEILFATTNDCRCEIDQVLIKSTKDIAEKMAQKNAAILNPAQPLKSNPAAVVEPVKTENGNTHKLKTNLGLKIAAGALTFGAAVVGYYMETQVQKKASDNQNAYAAYGRNPTNAAYAAYQAQYTDNCNWAKKYGLYRNISYGFAGLCGAGFVLTFFF
jgi:TolB-like protein